MSERSDQKPPWYVGLVRGGAGGVLVALIGVIVVQLGNVDAGTLTPYLPVAVLALRTVEAWILDQRKAATVVPEGPVEVHRPTWVPDPGHPPID